MFFDLFKNTKLYKNLNSSEFNSALQNDKSAVIIDVRTPSEFRSGKIKGARNIDVSSSSFLESIKNLPKDKNYYIYCMSGGRSGRACSMMAKEGFKTLFNLSGGVMSWKGELVK